MLRKIIVKNAANLITLLRILCAGAMVLAAPFSAVFWVFYLCGGISDAFDGFAARRLHQQSAAGARLDSAADVLFTAAAIAAVVRAVPLPAWLLGCACVAALLRLASYSVGYFKYRMFVSLHTYANKAAGALLFGFPLLYGLCGLTAAGILTGGAAVLSAAEELMLIAASRTPDPDCKGLFLR